jgi:hypothetical protein
VWKDKQTIVILSTHAVPILELSIHDIVCRKIGGKKEKVLTCHMHLQYT